MSAPTTTRITSGLTALDTAFTCPSPRGLTLETLGAWDPGELHLITGRAGTGLSSLKMRLAAAAAKDLTERWGRTHDKVLVTSSESRVSELACQLRSAAGDQLDALSAAIVLAEVQTTRQLVATIFDLVADAARAAEATGADITDCGLPAVILVSRVYDLVHHLRVNAPGTADVLTRGLAAWDVHAMEQLTGLSYQDRTGTPWPAGMESFRPAVVAFTPYWSPTLNPWDPNDNLDEDDYAPRNVDGTLAWQPEPGDLPLPHLVDIYGHAELVSRAAAVVLVHRRQTADARVADGDQTVKLLILKSRSGAAAPVVQLDYTPRQLEEMRLDPSFY